jgi:tRNA-dihydrouridine synthase
MMDPRDYHEYGVHGCMVGREAYRNIWMFADADALIRSAKKGTESVVNMTTITGTWLCVYMGICTAMYDSV